MARGRHNVLNTDRMLYRDERRLPNIGGSLPLFIHVPKVAGRYIKKCFKNAGIKLGNSVHTPARFVRDKVPKYDERVSFALVRNPYERFLSACLFNHIPVSKIEEVSNRMVNGDLDVVSEYNIYHYEHFFTQKHFVTDFDNETCIVDIIGRYEDLPAFVEELKSNGIDISAEFSIKEGKATDWENILSEVTKENVRKLFDKDFSYFKYDK